MESAITLLLHSSSRPAGRAANNPPAILRTAPAVDGDVVASELVADAEPDDVADADVLLSSKDVCDVSDAVTPVALVQALGTEEALPSTNLTAAHCKVLA